MRRTGFQQRSAPLRATKRLRPVSRKRKANERAYSDVVTRVFLRAKGQCEVVLSGKRCPERAKDPHHVQKRSAGGPDTDANLIAICRFHHDATDHDYQRGRLVIQPLGNGAFSCAVVVAASKHAVRAGGS